MQEGTIWRLKGLSQLPPEISRTTNQPAKGSGTYHRLTPTNPSSLSEVTKTVQGAWLNLPWQEKQKSHRTVHKKMNCTIPELLTWIQIMQMHVEKLCPERGNGQSAQIFYYG
jgi:hypothetical protein